MSVNAPSSPPLVSKSASTGAESRALLSIRVVLDTQSRFTLSVSRAVADFSRAAFANADTAARLRMAAHELLENAAQYGTSPTVSLELTLEQGASPEFYVVTLRATNMTTLARLREAAQWVDAVSGAQDPIEHYDRLVRERAGESGSGLGLARIRAEGEFAISYDISASELSVIARTVIVKGAGEVTDATPATSAPGFDCQTRVERDVLVVRIAGEGGMEEAGQLEAFLSALPARAASLGLNSVRLDLQRVEFLSSSCLKAFTNLALRASDPGRTLRLEFSLNAEMAWQARSFAVLQRFAPSVITLG